MADPNSTEGGGSGEVEGVEEDEDEEDMEDEEDEALLRAIISASQGYKVTSSPAAMSRVA